MSIFNKLLEKDENQDLPGDSNKPEKSNDFFFCFNIKYLIMEVGSYSMLRKRRSRKELDLLLS